MFFFHYMKSQQKYNVQNYTYRLWIKWQTNIWIFRNTDLTTFFYLLFLVILLPATKVGMKLICHDESWYDTKGSFKLSTGHKLSSGSQIYSCY